MRTIDRAKTTRAEVDKAIAEAVRSGETLTITHHGEPRAQVCVAKPVEPFPEEKEALEEAYLRGWRDGVHWVTKAVRAKAKGMIDSMTKAEARADRRVTPQATGVDNEAKEK